MLIEAVDNAESKVRLENLVRSCEQAMTKSFGKHEQLCFFADKTADPETLKSGLKNWLSDVTAENDTVLKIAHEYADGLPKTAKTSQSSVKTSPKTASASQTYKTSTSRISTTSSQRQQEFFLAKHRREEIERQNESLLHLPRQKQELDSQQLTQEKQRIEQEEDGMKKEQTLMLNSRKIIESNWREQH